MITVDEALDRMRVPGQERIFVLDCWQELPLTFYRQQLRAHNLIYALAKKGLLGDGMTLGVVGGGVAGLTAAAAAARIGCRVFLAEKENDILSLQGQNRTRWLHPHILDWPEENSDHPQSGLPVLSWHADIAEKVINQLRSAWAIDAKRYTKLIKWDCNVIAKISPSLKSGEKPKIEWSHSLDSTECDIIIVATGFGLEKSFNGVPPLSYWQNEDIDQTYPFNGVNCSRILISGVGDGGLIDFIRSRFNRFNHLDTYSKYLELAADQDLKKELMRIEKDSHGDSRKLKESYEVFNTPALNAIDDWVRMNLRGDTSVTLLGSNSPYSKKAALVNRFLVSRILKMDSPGGSTIIQGKLVKVTPKDGILEAEIECNDGSHQTQQFERIIIRHGSRVPYPLKYLNSDIADACVSLRGKPEPDCLRSALWLPHDPDCFSGAKHQSSEGIDVTIFTSVTKPIGQSGWYCAGCIVLRDASVLQKACEQLIENLKKDNYLNAEVKARLIQGGLPAIKEDISKEQRLRDRLIELLISVPFDAYMAVAGSNRDPAEDQLTEKKLLHGVVVDRLRDKSLLIKKIIALPYYREVVAKEIIEYEAKRNYDKYANLHNSIDVTPSVIIDVVEFLCYITTKHFQDQKPQNSDFMRIWGKIRLVRDVDSDTLLYRDQRIDFSKVKNLKDLSLHFRCRDIDIIHHLQVDQGNLYKKMYIPKKGKNRADQYRVVYKVEDQQLKQWQKILLSALTAQILYSPYVQGFYPKCSIKGNARNHMGKKVLLHADIADFFDSIKQGKVEDVFQDLGCNPSIAKVLAQLCTFNGSLPQGANTSPVLANMACRSLDSDFAQLAHSHGCSYTRYADDLTFSGDAVPDKLHIRRILNRYGYELSDGKWRLQKEGCAQYVTGLSVAEKTKDAHPRVPRKMKRRLRTELHFIKNFGFENHLQRIGQDIQPSIAERRMKGTIDFIHSIEPKVAAKFYEAYNIGIDIGKEE